MVCLRVSRSWYRLLLSRYVHSTVVLLSLQTSVAMDIVLSRTGGGLKINVLSPGLVFSSSQHVHAVEHLLRSIVVEMNSLG